MYDLSTGFTILLVCCLLLACLFEFINGFHDTANAVATVIYTNSLPPTVAVIYSGILNFLGVTTGGIAVAMGIINLLPFEVLFASDLSDGIAVILALLLSAIIWNLGTWLVGIPASSSHTIIGAILGIGLSFYWIPGEIGGGAVNWDKAKETGLALLLSPLLGFSIAIVIMFVFKRLVKNEVVYKEPIPGKHPPIWIRMMLWMTCGMVSFFHGQNDGQKGVGIVMIILISILPAQFSLDEKVNLQVVNINLMTIKDIVVKADTLVLGKQEKENYYKVLAHQKDFESRVFNIKRTKDVPLKLRLELRKDISNIMRSCEKLLKSGNFSVSSNNRKAIKREMRSAKSLIEYAPGWVTLMISISLGLGTMIGWKRIVKTVGEKIGKQHMSYAQGASAELVASLGIGMASAYGMPVSTTHMLSSGIAGTMVAKKGLKNLQKKTVISILLAWVLTLPVTIVLSGGFFLLFRAIL